MTLYALIFGAIVGACGGSGLTLWWVARRTRQIAVPGTWTRAS